MVEHFLQEQHHHQVDQGHRDVGEEGAVGAAADDVAGLGQVLQGDVAADGGLLEQDDQLVAQRGQHVLDRLGQDDLPGGLGVVQAQAAGGLHLSRRQAHDAAAEDLGHIGAAVDPEGQDGHRHLADIHRAEDDKVHDEQLDHGGGAADDGQVQLAQPVQDAQVSGLVMGGADVRDDEAQHHAQRRCRKGNDQGGFQTVQEEQVALLLDEGGDELAGKFLPQVLEKCHELPSLTGRTGGEYA